MDRKFIAASDFFFLSTVDHNGYPTVSYKGGPPGFVTIVDDTMLAFPAYDGNGSGAIVGYDLPPYAEQVVVHTGNQSMPYAYDNNLKVSEATMTLSYPRDWTEGGVTQLSLWFRGGAANAAERMFVALGNAVVYHDDASVTQMTGWTEWVIDLASFAGGGLIGLAGALGGGWLSIVSGGLAALLGLGFASLRLLSGQAPNRPTVGVGEPMLAFSAPDADGAVFDSASLSGRPYLLKFFRGHW
jgi:hypothetical protein